MEQGNSMPLLSEQLAATTLATYATNHAIIRLSHEASFWIDDNEPNLERLAVFAHEYAHFLHNFSTTAGIYGFIATLRLLSLFMNTVDQSGKSRGSAALGKESQSELTAILSWKQHLQGSFQPPFPTVGVHASDIEVIGISRKTGEIHLAAQRFPAHNVDITVCERIHNQRGELRLGSYALMEAIAWEIEHLIFEAEGRDVAAVDLTVPMWPYKLPRAIFESVSGVRLSSRQMAEVELLALLSSDPGDAFVAAAEILKANSPIEGSDEIIRRIREVMLADFAAVQAKISASLLQDVETFSPRPTIYRGLKAMSQWAVDYLKVRAAQPFFELNALQTTDRQRLVELLKQYPPCPVLQETGPNTGEMELFLISDSEPPPQLATDLGVTQSLLQFAGAHTRVSGIVSTDQAQEGLCRFFGPCKAPLTTTSPHICRRRPWESFQPGAAGGCWYSAGVALARSLRPN